MRKLYQLTGQDQGPPPLADYRAARRLGGVLLGEENLYFPGLARVAFLPLSRIVWIYKRRVDSSATVCCGRTTFSSFSLVVHADDGTTKQAVMEHERLADLALKRLAQQNPAILVGYPRERAAAPGRTAEPG